jgi:hypothetical protein
MKLSNKAIEDFKKLYLKKHNIKLSDEEANRLGVELLQFIKEIYKPIPKTYGNK